MSPESLTIDRRFTGVGRIVRATGSQDPLVRRRMNAMLDELASPAHPRLDLLRAIKSGALSLLVVYDAYRRHALESLATPETMHRAVAALSAWRDSLRVPDDVSHKHHISLGVSIGYLRRHAPNATLHELPTIVRELRQTVGREHPRSFNLLRSAVQAYLRDTFGKHHRLWLEVGAVPLRRIAPKPPRHTLTPARMWTNATDAIAWAMATTGMHPSEYWGVWSVKRDRIHIEGTKRAGRRRDVPLVWALAEPPLSRSWWEKRLRARANGVQPYDFRRSYARWCEDAGVPRTRRRLYLGHRAGDVTDLYERHEIAEYLTSDAAALRAYVARPSRDKGKLRLA
jgi:hypothetical protein